MPSNGGVLGISPQKNEKRESDETAKSKSKRKNIIN